ncbi:MAG: hypothetical protein GWO24_37640, partial [Akkermansiaceae bacterium]|nr:hypothetical protein [Akkermansiaceae bacterium]
MTDYLDAGGHYHANFRIDRGAGGYLALAREDGPGKIEIVSEFADYPRQRENISYGRYGEELPLAVGYFSSPTPGHKNSRDAVNGFVADTRFSHDRGLYDAPFRVGITCGTPDAVIRYTTDGSPPTLENGHDYHGDGGIAIATTTTLRAAAFRDGWEPTNIDTQTYLFPEHVADQPDRPLGFPTTWTGWDYGMDQDHRSLRAIAALPDASVAEAKAVITNALHSLPTMSVVMDVE